MSHGTATAAVIVTFNPDEGVGMRLGRIATQCDLIVVVDNGSTPGCVEELRTCVAAAGGVLIANSTNRGLSIALNQGMEAAANAGFDWVVTFDQDSTPQPGMVAALQASVQRCSDPGRIAVAGACTIDERKPDMRETWLRPGLLTFKLVPCVGSDLHGITFVITSGALTSVEVWRRIGGFDEGLFIDYIDHDFCLKAHWLGLDTIVSAEAHLLHNFGSKREVVVAGRTLRPTFHSAMRHYYMMRNRVLMWKRHGWRYPHWWLFDTCFGVMNLVRVMVAEDRRGQKLRAVCSGLWDGLLGRTGACPPEKLTRFTR